VIYLPATERQSHYFHVRPADQFDAMIHIDDTRTPEPLELTSEWIAGELPETYPTGSSAGAAAPAGVACFDPAWRF
jgi:hypothetical protein